LQGASAFTEVLKEFNSDRVQVFAVWERVIATDWFAPSESVLSRLPDARIRQHWDPDRWLSRRLGEKDGDRKSIVWDWVAVYKAGVRWGEVAPEPAYQGRPVVNVTEELRAALSAAMSRD
jgi:hypothetical protein